MKRPDSSWWKDKQSAIPVVNMNPPPTLEEQEERQRILNLDIPKDDDIWGQQNGNNPSVDQPIENPLPQNEVLTGQQAQQLINNNQQNPEAGGNTNINNDANPTANNQPTNEQLLNLAQMASHLHISSIPNQLSNGAFLFLPLLSLFFFFLYFFLSLCILIFFLFVLF
jgi:hypothetical protein